MDNTTYTCMKNNSSLGSNPIKILIKIHLLIIRIITLIKEQKTHYYNKLLKSKKVEYHNIYLKK